MMIAGFCEPDSGSITVGGRDVTRLAPQKRNLGFVFQQYLLFPHMTVGENVAFPLQLRGVAKAEIRRRVGETLEIAGLSGYRPAAIRVSCPAVSSSASRCAGRWSTGRRSS